MKHIIQNIHFWNEDKLIEKAKTMGNTFLGGPLPDFENIGRLYLTSLLRMGIYPDSKVLDVGCGCLRGGYWLINFLNEGCYYGIEPNKEMVEKGKKKILDKKLIKNKKPKVNYNDNFDFSVFNINFDFVMARSIWTHASPNQIRKMLDSFNKNTKKDGKFLTSYYKTDKKENENHKDSWIGKSHKSDTAKHRYYTFETLKNICKEKDLDLKELEYGIYNTQYWLLIKKSQATW